MVEITGAGMEPSRVDVLKLSCGWLALATEASSLADVATGRYSIIPSDTLGIGAGAVT